MIITVRMITTIAIGITVVITISIIPDVNNNNININNHNNSNKDHTIKGRNISNGTYHYHTSLLQLLVRILTKTT